MAGLPERSTSLPRAQELDGLRGLLALWVAVAHLCAWSGFQGSVGSSTFHQIWESFAGAAIPVELFIILSGFAITFLLNTKPQPYFAYMRDRFFRIYPVYLVCLLIGFAIARLIPFVLKMASWRDSPCFVWYQEICQNEQAAPLTHLGAHLTLFQGLIPNTLLGYSTASLPVPAWSISLEWQFYLVAPVIVWMIRYRIGAGLLVGMAFLGYQVDSSWSNPFPALLIHHLFLFLLGIGSFYIYRNDRSKLETGFYHQVGMILLVATAIWMSSRCVAIFSWLFVFVALLQNEKMPIVWRHSVRQVLMHPALQFLGKISYPLYLIHFSIAILLVAGLLYFYPSVTSLQCTGLMLMFGLPIIIGLAFFLHKWVESPSMSIFKQRKRTKPLQNQAQTGYLAGNI